MSRKQGKSVLSRGTALFLWACLAIAAVIFAAQSILSSGDNTLIAMFKLDRIPPLIETRFSPSEETAVQQNIANQSQADQSQAELSERLAMLDEKVSAITQSLDTLQLDTSAVSNARIATNNRIDLLEATFESITGSLRPVTGPDADAVIQPLDPSESTGISVNVSNFPVEQVMNEDQRSPIPGTVGRTDFAVIVARNGDIAALSRIWARIRDEQGSRIDGLVPRVKLESDDKSGLQLALLAGPLRNAQTAIELCASLGLPSHSCQPVLYGGNPLPGFSIDIANQ